MPLRQRKILPTTICKVDAAQFFKSASPKRAFRRCQALLSGILAEGRYDAIAVHRHIRGYAHLANFADSARKNQALRLAFWGAAME